MAPSPHDSSAGPVAAREPFASVTVVNWNGREHLAECLNSLRSQTDRGFEVVVVDNGSTDGSEEMLRREYPEARVIQTGANLGFAEASNRAIDAAKGAWVATLNNDAVAEPGWMAALRAAATAGGDRLGMLQSCIVFKSRPGILNSTGIVVNSKCMAADRDFERPIRANDAPDEIFCPSAGAALYRRAMLEAVRLPSGVFDRRFFMYLEDVDLGWRCRLAGWTAMYVPASVVRHVFHGSSVRRGKEFIDVHCHENRLWTLFKNASARFIVRSRGRTITSFCWLCRHRGFRGAAAFFRIVAAALRERRLVKRLATRTRRDVESDWVIDAP